MWPRIVRILPFEAKKLKFSLSVQVLSVNFERAFDKVKRQTLLDKNNR
jgi:hypothetical protein